MPCCMWVSWDNLIARWRHVASCLLVFAVFFFPVILALVDRGWKLVSESRSSSSLAVFVVWVCNASEWNRPYSIELEESLSYYPYATMNHASFDVMTYRFLFIYICRRGIWNDYYIDVNLIFCSLSSLIPRLVSDWSAVDDWVKRILRLRSL